MCITLAVSKRKIPVFFGVVFTVLPSSDSHLPGRKSKVVLERYGPFKFSFSFLKLRANFKLKQVLLG